MRILMLGLLLATALVTSAWAQGYVYQASGLEYKTTVPVSAGQTVTGLLRLPSGVTALGQIEVADIYYDDLFAYWIGTYNGEMYVYDIYSTYWKPLPVTYEFATLNFKGDIVEGWVRAFAGRIDNDHFFGRDGILYKRISITRNRKRDTNRRRQIIYSYFVNMATGERSDDEGLPYRIIGDADVAAEVISEVMLARETELVEIVDSDPAYPLWETAAQEPPAEIAVPDSVNAADGQNLLELIEDEIGPLTVGPQPAADATAAPADETAEPANDPAEDATAGAA